MVISIANGYPSAEKFTAIDPVMRNAMKAGPWVLILTYFFLTVAELFISPLGLSFVSKVAPKHLQGLCQGLWLGATAVGNCLAVDRSAHVQQMAHLGVLARLRPGLLHLHGGDVRHGEMAGASNAIGIGPQLNNMRTQQQGNQAERQSMEALFSLAWFSFQQYPTRHISMKHYDYLIVGSGLFGATFAYRARQAGKSCLVIDKRKQLGGNVFCKQIEGINVHQYGAHIFHTNSKKVWDFVNSLVPFNRYTNSPVACWRGHYYNCPST